MARGKGAGRYTPNRKSDDGDDSERWLATYADMVTLLMAFFVMLYAMSEIDVVKFAAFVEGLEVPFGNVSGEGAMPESDGLLPESEGLEPDQTPPSDEQEEPDEQEKEERTEPLPPEEMLAAAAARAAAEDQLDEIAEALDANLAEEGLDQFVEQRREERGLIVSIASDDVLFATGSHEVSRLGRRVVRTVARTLDAFPNPLMIEGHTDDVPLRRAGETNWNLSTDRAVAVLQLMVERHGLPPTRVGAVGYGEHRPLVENRNDASRARNRRVDIAVLIEENLP